MSNKIAQSTTGSPLCPNHHVAMLRTGDRYKWQCPISEALFDVEIDLLETEIKRDKFGNTIKNYVITGEE